MSKKGDATNALSLLILFVLWVVAILIFFMALFFFSPGAAVTALIAQMLGLQLDSVQAWIFAVLFSAIIGLGYYAHFRDAEKTQKAYLLTCAVAAAVYALASLGFHAEWANTHLAHYLPGVKNMQAKGSRCDNPPPSWQPARGAAVLEARSSPQNAPVQASTRTSMTERSNQLMVPAPAAPVQAPLEPTLVPPQETSHRPSSTGVDAVEQVNHPSFDCGKSRVYVEKMICANQKLSAMDQRLHALYREVRLNAIAGNVKADQVQWLKQHRNVCDDAVCLFSAYHERLEQLQKQVVP